MTCARRAIVAALGLSVALTCSAAAHTGSQLVIIVRHAEKAETPKDDVALSERGRARAEALVSALGDAGVDMIITTERRRSIETAAPLAQHLHLTPIVVRTADDAHAAAVAAAVRQSGSVVLVVGHSNTVPAIIQALGGPHVPDICDGQYGLLFTLRVEEGTPARLISSTYGLPDPMDDECRAMPAGR
jgi:broad specificity phosphatase PhoE